MPSKGRLTIVEKLAAQYLALGMTREDVSTATELPTVALRRLEALPLFMHEVDQCRARAFPALADRLSRRLEEMQLPALDKMEALMSAESESVQFQASKELLSRGPLGVAQSQARGGQEAGLTITLDQQALAAILGGALNAGHHAIVAAFTSLNAAPPLALPVSLDIASVTTHQEEEEAPPCDDSSPSSLSSSSL